MVWALEKDSGVELLYNSITIQLTILIKRKY